MSAPNANSLARIRAINYRVPRPVIFGCAGPELSEKERTFFNATQPLGFILFARNCVDPAQVRALVASLRAAVERRDAPVLIDQEGGRVQRLGPPHWPSRPSAGRIAELSRRDRTAGRRAARLAGRLIAQDLKALGINVNCAPVLDVLRPETHGVIGDRAFGDDPRAVAALGRAFAMGLQQGGVLPIVKHVPGHGRARADSHLELPVVEAGLEELEATDFVPFRLLSDLPWAMTAHVLYRALDAENPATTSPKIITDVIRGHMRFGGVLLSDDLSMQALKGSLADRARAALAAGCDVVLHCNGKMDEMVEIAAAAPNATPVSSRRVARTLATRPPRNSIAVAAASAELDSLLAGI